MSKLDENPFVKFLDKRDGMSRNPYRIADSASGLRARGQLEAAEAKMLEAEQRFFDLYSEEAHLAAKSAFNIGYKDARFELGWIRIMQSKYSVDTWDRIRRKNLGQVMNEWKGEPLEGHPLHVFDDEGPGDRIQFSRYFHLLPDDSTVQVHTDDSLIRLYRSSFPWFSFNVERYKASKPALYDKVIFSMQLPIGTNHVNPYVGKVPYLIVPEDLEKNWQDRLPITDKVRVGLVWHGSSDSNGRNTNLQSFASLFQIGVVEFHSLTYDDQQSQDYGIPTYPLTDFADTAALAKCMDLIISVDTAVAHLAGALGRPIWTLVENWAEWRWGDTESTTAWYPTMKLYRNRPEDNWEKVIAQLSIDLRKLAEERNKNEPTVEADTVSSTA